MEVSVAIMEPGWCRAGPSGSSHLPGAQGIRQDSTADRLGDGCLQPDNDVAVEGEHALSVQ